MKVSLVVPVKNEADSIESLMSSVAGQTRRPDEMIIVDGGSEDGTPEIVEDWVNRRSLSDWARVVRVDDATPGKGRNIGVANARYNWIAFTDAGIRVEQPWLERLIEVAERDNQIDVVYGSYEPVTETLFERCAALAYVAPKELRAGQWMRGPRDAFIAHSSRGLGRGWRLPGFKSGGRSDLYGSDRTKRLQNRLGAASSCVVANATNLEGCLSPLCPLFDTQRQDRQAI